MSHQWSRLSCVTVQRLSQSVTILTLNSVCVLCFLKAGLPINPRMTRTWARRTELFVGRSLGSVEFSVYSHEPPLVGLPSAAWIFVVERARDPARFWWRRELIIGIFLDMTWRAVDTNGGGHLQRRLFDLRNAARPSRAFVGY
ncbi:hypothetical protein R3P38DRAFT_3224836 [Favolaschia claudopus]|uniref:Uncharacterized protein n=1 Tax=Favolaschia claudopus TaxID=2862362 RepID=A0AAV9ZV64_9AGAR